MSNLSYIVVAALFSIVGVWMIATGELAGWLVLLFFGPGGVFLFVQARQETVREDEKEQYREERKAEIEKLRNTAAENGITVPENPVEVWQSMLVEEGADWVVFENGTLVICQDGKPPVESALEIIGRFTRTVADTSLGDFSVTIRPEFGVWIISYPGNDVVNYVEIESCANDTAAGMIARAIRESDANERNIVHVQVSSTPE